LLNKLLQTIAGNDFKTASEMLPRKIELVFDQPKIREMIMTYRSAIPVKRMIQFELIKMAELMSVGGNLNGTQVDFIADQLIDMYPNESIADFKICFERCAMGRYGQIQRMDGITIGEWMKQYLSEKYEVMENQLMKERDEYYKVVIPENSDRDWLAEWQNAVDNSGGMKRVPDLTEEEIKEEGQTRPKEKVYSYNESEAEIRLREHHELLWANQERTVRERHPELTEEQIQMRLVELKNHVLTEESKPKHAFSEVAKIWAAKKKKRTA
jgi:hypothetical protein